MTVLSAFLSIFTVVAVVYAILMMLINLLIAGRRSWIMGMVRILLTVLAAVAALPVARLVSGILNEPVYNFVRPMLGSKVNDFFDTVVVGAEGVRMLVTLVALPILYVVIFIVFRLILALVGWILCRCIVPLRMKTLRGVSRPLGALNGLLIAVVTLVPLCGFLAMGGHALSEVSACVVSDHSTASTELLGKLGGDKNTLSQIGKQMAHHPVVTIVNGTIGDPIFDTLTTAQLDTTATHGKIIEMDLETELTGFLCTAVYAVDAVGALDNEVYTVTDKTLLVKTADCAMESEWVKLLAGDVVVELSEHWLDDETFIGMKPLTLDANVAPTFDHLLLILSTETSDTLDEDIHTVVDIVGDFLIYDLLSDEIDPNDMIRVITESGLVDNTLAKLEANERLAPLAEEIRALCLRLVSDMLGLDALLNGEYAEMMNQLAGLLTLALSMDESERNGYLSIGMSEVFDTFGFSVPSSFVTHTADGLVTELGEDGVVTGDELTGYLVRQVEDSMDAVLGGA